MLRPLHPSGSEREPLPLPGAHGGRLLVRWLALLAVTAAFVALFTLLHLGAALFLGALLGAVVLAASGARVAVPLFPYRFAQAVLGCLIARSLSAQNLAALGGDLPLFLGCIFAVIAVSVGFGSLLARAGVLPGTTAVWGAAPGAASVMTLMSEHYGGDVRLVAFMQYLRVLLVALSASLVAHAFMPAGALVARSPELFPSLPLAPFTLTLALALLGTLLGSSAKLPAGPLLVPLVIGGALVQLGWVELFLPPWLLGLAYALIGWSIGMRFTREILRYAARVLPMVAGSILSLIALCAGLAYLLHVLTGKDLLSAYLATSPGGADSVAIIAASSEVDLPFVMAMQTGRFLLVLIVGPSLARAVAHRAARRHLRS